jgi:hypothetical protein
MPDEEPRVIEARFDAGDLVGVGDDRVLVAGLPRLRLSGPPVKRFPVQHLKLHLVDVDRVGVLGEVVQFPDLDRVQGRGLGDLLVPVQPDGGPSASTVPRTASVGPTPARIFDISSLSDTRRVTVSGPSAARAGSVS